MHLHPKRASNTRTKYSDTNTFYFFFVLLRLFLVYSSVWKARAMYTLYTFSDRFLFGFHCLAASARTRIIIIITVIIRIHIHTHTHTKPIQPRHLTRVGAVPPPHTQHSRLRPFGGRKMYSLILAFKNAPRCRGDGARYYHDRDHTSREVFYRCLCVCGAYTDTNASTTPKINGMLRYSSINNSIEQINIYRNHFLHANA